VLRVTAIVTLLLALAASVEARQVRPTRRVDRTYSMVERRGLLGGMAKALRWMRHKPTRVQVRIQSTAGVEAPDRTLHALAVAAGRMHERRGYAISNLCRRVSVDLGEQVDRRVRSEPATLLYNGSLSEVDRSLLPKGWKKPIGWGNHWITYCKIGDLHYAVDGTAQDYLNRSFTPQSLRGKGRLDAEIFVAATAAELRTMLAGYYGGLPDKWIRQRRVDLRQLERKAPGRLPDAFYRQAYEPIPFPGR
jgi:hypothetical protein